MKVHTRNPSRPYVNPQYLDSRTLGRAQYVNPQKRHRMTKAEHRGFEMLKGCHYDLPVLAVKK